MIKWRACAVTALAIYDAIPTWPISLEMHTQRSIIHSANATTRDKNTHLKTLISQPNYFTRVPILYFNDLQSLLHCNIYLSLTIPMHKVNFEGKIGA